MKNFILIIPLYIAKILMKIIYFFIKIFTRQQNKVTMLSRQSNDINLDFRLIKEELEKEKNIKIITNNEKKLNIENNSKKTRNSKKINNLTEGNRQKEEKIKLKIKILCKKIPKNFGGRLSYCFYIVKCMYHIATSKVCIVDGYNIPICALKHKKNLEIIQIWHALGAIKKFGYQVLDKKEGTSSKVAKIMDMHSNYNCVTCASEATRKIYAEAFNTDLDKIKVMGMPRIDYILSKDNEINKKVEELKMDYPNFSGKKTILYVPTFRRGQTINISKIEKAINKEKYNLIIRLHPLDNTKVSEEYLVNRKYSTFDLIKFADYIVTDYSAIAFETATLGKPLFFYLFDIDNYKDRRGLNIDLQQEMPNCTKATMTEIAKIIEKDTYNYEELKKFREKYVETIDTNNTERICDYVIDTLASTHS